MKRTFATVMICSLALAACATDDDDDLETPPPDGTAVDAIETRAIVNPLSPVVGFEQFNLSETWGSCGSHSGAVAIAKLEHDGKVVDVKAIEKALYYNYGGRVDGGPGAVTLEGVYNKYFKAHGMPYKAVLFHSSSSVLHYIDTGSPVVAHTSQWGGHYVAIYGLVGGEVYFSDGCVSDGVSASLPRGNLKKWAWSTFLHYAKGDYIAFVHL